MDWSKILMMILSYGAKQRDYKETASKSRFAYILAGLFYIFVGLIAGFIPAMAVGLLLGDKWFGITYLSIVIITGVAGLYMLYKGMRGFIDKDYYNNVLLKQSAKQTLKHLKIPERMEELSSWLNQKGSNFEYSKVKDFLQQQGDLYIANFKVSNETKEIVNNKLVSQAEKVEIRIEPSELTKTALVIGRMGSGKSVFLKNIYSQQKWNRAIINDVKGEYVEAFYDAERDIIYNPFDKRTLLWDMFSDIKRNPALASVIAEAIVLSISKEKDFWLSSASKLLETALLKAVFSDYSNKYLQVLKHVNEYRAKAEEQVDKTALSVYATLQPVLDVFMLLAFLESKNYKKFSIYDFANSNNQRTIFLLLDPAHAKAIQPFTNALLSVLISVLLSKPDTKSDFTLFLLDEFLNIQIPESVLTPLFTTARSKGIQLVLASQYLPQDTNSNKLTQLILNSRHILALFKITEPNTIDIIKNSFGEYEAIHRENSYSYSKTKHLLTTQTTTTTNTHRQTEKKSIIDEVKILSLEDYQFIYSQANPLKLCLAKVEKFFFEDKKRNNYFEELDLSEYYKTFYFDLSNLQQLEEIQTQAETQTEENTTNEDVEEVLKRLESLKKGEA